VFHVKDAGRSVFEDFDARSNFGQAQNGKQNLSVEQPRVSTAGASTSSLIRMQRRLFRGETIKNVLAQIKHSARASTRTMGSVGVDTQVTREKQQLATGATRTVDCIATPWNTDPFSALPRRACQALRAAECTTRPGEWNLDRLGMGTSGCSLVNDFKIPTIGYGPGTEEAAHASNEYVDLENLAEVVYGTAAIAHGLVGVPVYGWALDEI
jgi:acetylornithine deacetylase/succinyl-diaminopimelate desuccinylase-like protein